ncbi:MAG: MFS transporter, partial [Acidimicrobiales bacterium]
MSTSASPVPTGTVALSSRSGLHYGWIVVALTFLILLTVSGLRAMPTVIIKPLEEEFSWDRAGISFAIAIGWLVMGLSTPFAGPLINRIGIRSVMILGLALTIIGTGATMIMTSLIELNLYWGVVG